jgi:phage shock protein PspC (stress-responsive transcriptional regulator)
MSSTPPHNEDDPLTSGDPLGGGPEQPTPEQPPPAAAGSPGQAPRRLTRSSTDKLLGGVAGGLGRYFNIDPIIFRIGFVVLTLAGGVGAVAYLAAWLLVPSEPIPGAPPQDRSRALTIIGIVVLVIAALAAIGPGLVFLGPPLFGLAFLALIGVLLWRAAGGGPGGDTNVAARRIGLGILLLVVAAGGFVAVAVGVAVGGGAIVAGLVIALGIGLAVSAFLGGARWLVVPALILAIPLGFAAAANTDVDGGVGDRDYDPTRVSELRRGYELGMGELRVDLRNVDLPAGRTPLRIDVGVGEARVLVPEDVCVASDVRVGMGHARVLDRESNGVDVDWRQSPVERPGVKRLVIDAEVGIGALRIGRSDADLEWDDRFDGGFGGSFDRPRFLEGNAACTRAA